MLPEYVVYDIYSYVNKDMQVEGSFALTIRAPDKVCKINLNRLYLCYISTKSYVWPLVRNVSMRRF